MHMSPPVLLILLFTYMTHPSAHVGLKSLQQTQGAIHSPKISGNFGLKLNGSVRSNQKGFEKVGPPFEVDHFSVFI